MIAEKSSAFEESARLLLQLHSLMSAGRGESQEADDVRDEMDAPWHSMTIEEQNRLRGLSADLYTIGDDRDINVERDTPFTQTVEGLTAAGRWGEILDLLREKELSQSPRNIAYARGLCWAHLGQPNVAIEFLREAARLRHLTPAEEILVLTCYEQARRTGEVLRRAQEIRSSEIHPLLLLKAAEIFSVAADEPTSPSATEYRYAAIDCAERAQALLQRIQMGPDNQDVFRWLYVPALLHLAINYDQLNERDKAIDACRKALDIEPENPNALMLYGFLKFDEFPRSQRDQFIGQLQDRLSSATNLAPQLN